MGAPLTILHTADTHIGAALPVRPRRDIPRRGDDFVDAFERVVDRARAEDVALAIHAGDLFDRSRPSSRALAAAAQPLLKLAAADIPVIIIPGNHERSTIPATLLLAHRNIHIITRPTTLTFQFHGIRIAISAFPCLQRDADRQFAAVLDETEWDHVDADLSILATHQTFESATCGPGDFRFRGGDNVVPRDAVPAEFDYVAAGHIHRHQVLTTPHEHGPPIVYCGSPDRISFAEVSEPKGCVLIDVAGDALQHRFIEHDVRPMSIWPLDVSGLTAAQVRAQIEQLVTALPPRAIAQTRLTGLTTRAALRGVGLTALARELRPDVLFSVSAQAVEFAPQRAARAGAPAPESVFTRLNLPEANIQHHPATDVARLSTKCGVYALYDAHGRVLYVGKAKNIRTRVRTHLRGKSGANFFRGWGRQIAHIESLAADSELEALLIEAELIRLHRPPYNRQMRRWSSYRYLSENGQPHGQLVVFRQPSARQRCFGPFRGRRLAEELRAALAAHFCLAACPDEPRPTRQLPLLPQASPAVLCQRYYDRLCAGPCAGRIAGPTYAENLRRRDDLLAGNDDASLRELERMLADDADPSPQRKQGSRRDALDRALARVSGSDSRAERAHHDELSRQATTLRFAFEHTTVLRRARELLNGLLLMPGPEKTRQAALLTQRGVCFTTFTNDTAAAEALLAHWRRAVGRVNRRRPPCVPIAAVDGLCIIARHLSRTPDPYKFIPATRLPRLTAAQLLRAAFPRR